MRTIEVTLKCSLVDRSAAQEANTLGEGLLEELETAFADIAAEGWEITVEQLVETK